ncbi:MAG: hypothetical protein K6253_01165 [Candidatus Liberibacter asiaticus]|nr:hypothetical protein [Candidatus Liberibacter asiaticus]
MNECSKKYIYNNYFFNYKNINLNKKYYYYYYYYSLTNLYRTRKNS